MIRITWQRVNSGEIFQNPARNEEPYAALRSLAVHELGYGGQLTSVDTVGNHASITVVTRVLNCVDTTTFSGTPEEMRILLEFCACYALVAQARDMNRLSQQVLDTLGVNSNTLLITNMGPMLIGNSEVLTALAIWVGVRTEEEMNLAREVVSRNNRRSMNSGLVCLIEIIEFVRELGCSFEEACQQIGGVTPQPSAL